MRLVHARGRFMQEAVPEGHGAMAAVIGCGPGEVAAACAAAAAQTGPRRDARRTTTRRAQTVIAGDAAAVELACARARERGREAHGAARRSRLPSTAR